MGIFHYVWHIADIPVSVGFSTVDGVSSIAVGGVTLYVN
jgi:hypothetical protein